MMATEYKSYLAANILSEDRVITYRTLSRALSVHVNVAKEMLYEFHRLQNGKKPGSIYAIYLIAGTKLKPAPSTVNDPALPRDSTDKLMQSSPYTSSPNPDIEEATEHNQSICVTLVGEADLQELRPQYEAITSLHVYSLAPYPLEDLRLLSCARREKPELHKVPYAEEGFSVYGTIMNKSMRRRKGRRTSPIAAITNAQMLEDATCPQNRQDENSINNVSTSGRLSLKPQFGARSERSCSDVAISKSSQEKSKAPSKPHQVHSSSIFKSFAKAKPKLKREGTDSSAGASELKLAPSGADEKPMKDTSEDEEDGYVPPVRPTPSIVVEAYRKSREERAAALRNMMDEDDVAQESTVAPLGEESHELTENIRDSQHAEEAAQIIGSRRRGRRRVLKRKTIKDEDGYLVTREEPVWESFSEDEAVVTKPKPSSLPANSETVKKGLGRPGQGNIMSFFGKK